jgi:hypothetical protein
VSKQDATTCDTLPIYSCCRGVTEKSKIATQGF